MNNGSHPKFSSRQLREAASKASQEITSFSANLDAVSRDIKLLEAWLQEHDVCLQVEQVIGTTTECLEADNGYSLGGQPMYNGSAVRVTEKVAWGKHDSTGRWRLLYIKEAADGEVEIDEGTLLLERFGTPRQLEARPLIETPFQMRLKAHKQLPELLEAITAQTKVDRIRLPN